VRHVRQRHDRLVGFTYDEAAGVAHFSMYVPGTAGRVRKRATVRAASYDQAVGLWSAFRSRAAEGLRRPSPEAPTFLEFITDYFPSIEANVKEKTAIDYRYSIDRHLIPQLGALRLTEITSGVLNRLGSSLMASGYAGATVNKYMTLAALLLGYAVEFDVIAELPLKKKLKKQKANKPCLELNAEERAAFLAAFNDEPGFRRFLAETMPKGKQALSANLRGLVYLSSLLVSPMKAAREGSIVGILSTAALNGRPDEGAYAAAKWGARGYLECLRADCKGTGVSVISVFPGGMNTEFWSKQSHLAPDLGTYMDPREVARPVVEAAMGIGALGFISTLTIERR
jgi:hypothetical protein